MSKLFLIKRLFLSLAFLLLANTSFAARELTNARLITPNFIKGSSLYVMDNKYFQITAGGTLNFRDVNAKTRVLIGIDKANADVLTAYNYKFVVTVNYSTYSGSVLTPASSTQTLEVSYDPAQGGLNYKDLAAIEINGGYLVNAKIVDIINMATNTSVTNPPSNLYFETEIETERYYDMNFSSSLYTLSSPLIATAVSATDEIEVTWPYIPGAEEYDLEWVWVSDDIVSPFNYIVDFKNNSTRIRTSSQFYRVSNVFEKGKVFFRVRGVGYTGALVAGVYNQPYFTSWTMADYTSTTLGFYSCPSSPSNIFCITTDHEEHKNWQYKATYAEEGKKKEVVSYFDGTLRNRQSVTKSNSDDNAIVAETYYDYQGRAAVQALPVPVSNANIKFYQYNVALSGVTNNVGFNFVQGTKEVFDREHFDKDATGSTCDAVASGLDNNPLTGSSVGSAYYYSSDNINKTFQQGYVPDANHFPYSQTEYTPDNTGRISRQGGVGPLHQLSSGHETKYFYGSPTLQEELDRLFGSDVGDYKHYKKNMVIDANGQVSLSYLDQEGRTVATALAGQSPANTYSLASNTGTTSISGNLLNKDLSTDVDDDQDNNILGSGGKELTFSKDMLVTTQGDYKFTYDMTGTAFTYSCEAESRCYDCIYDLEINIFDKCGQNPTGFTPVKHKVGNILPEQINSQGGVDVNFTCDGPIQFSLTPSPLVVTLEPGAYTVYKKLSIDEDAMAAYLKEYINNNSCIRTEQSFIDSAKAHIDTSGCNLTCDACVASLGTEAEFIANGGTSTLYAQAVKDCREPCEYKTSCEAAYIAMLADVSPGGQYGDWENGNSCDPGSFPLSVLNEGNTLPRWGTTNISCWLNPKTISGNLHYYKEDGSIQYITSIKIDNATYIPPVNATIMGANLSLTPGSSILVEPQELADACTFKSQWRSSWAQSLVRYHPEYNYYEWCATNSVDNDPSNNYQVQYTPTAGTTLTGGVYTSDHYDSLLVEIQDLSLVTSNLTKVLDPLGMYGNSLADPYFGSSEPIAGKWYKNSWTANTVSTVPYSQYSSSPFMGNVHVPIIYTDAQERFVNYLGSGLNVYEFAYALVKGCATQYGTPMSSLIPSCFSMFGTRPTFGYSYSIMLPSAYVTAQESRDIWEKYKFLYLSLKQKLQNESAQSYAVNVSVGSSPLDARNQCNDCIGDPSFTPLHVPFATWSHGFGSLSSWLTNWFNLPSQSQYPTAGVDHYAPCGKFYSALYASKIKRFPSTADVLGQSTASNPDAQMYQATGKCPAATNLEVFIRDMAIQQKLSSTVSNLQTINGFTQGLYDYIYTTANSVPPSSYPPLAWTPSISGNVLTGNIGSFCNLVLNFPLNPQGFNWSNIGTSTNAITNVYNIQFISYSGGLSYFKLKMDISTATGAFAYEVTGTICGNIGNCTFPPVCKANNNAIAIRNLLNQLANENIICSNASTNITQPPFDLNFNPFVPAFLPSGLSWYWDHPTGTNNASIYNSATSTSLFFHTASTADFANLCGSTSTHVISVLSIVPDGSGIDGQGILKYSISDDPTGGPPTVTTGTMAVTLSISNGTTYTGINLGTCEQSESLLCNTNEHKVKNDLESFLTTNNYTSVLNSSTAVNITDNHNFSSLLASHAAGSSNINSSSANIVDPEYYWIKGTSSDPTKTLIASICSSTTGSAPTPTNSCCSITLSFSNTATTYDIGDISSLSDMHVLTYPTFGGLQYSFTILATFPDLHTELLVGNTSCFPIRECMDCEKDEDDSETSVVPCTEGTVWEDFESISSPSSTSYPTIDASYPPPTACSSGLSYTYQSSIPPLPDNTYGFSTTSAYAGTSFYLKKGECWGNTIAFEKTASALTPGVNYVLSAKVMINGFSTSSLDVALFVNGTQVGIHNMPNAGTAWNTVSFPVTVYSTSDVIRLKILSPSGPTSYCTGTFGLDDIRLCDNASPPCSAISTEDFTSFNSSSPGFTSSKTYDASCSLNTNGYKVISSSTGCPVINPSTLNFDIFNHTPFVSASNYMFVQFKGDAQSDLYKKIYTVTPGRFYDFSAFLVSDTIHEGTLAGSITLKIDDGVSNVTKTTSMSALYSPTWQWTFKNVSLQAASTTITVSISNSNSMGTDEAMGIDDIVFTECVSPPCDDDLPLDTFPSITYVNPCVQAAIDDAIAEGLDNFHNYIDSLKTDFIEQYIKKCMGGAIENFFLDYASREYHYTLYYYDQAGNLVQTIPPQGVSILTAPADLAAARAARAGGTQFATNHSMGTTYTYNSLNQLVKQYTPDAGESNFWYDALGRLVASQNAKQAARFTSHHNHFSYTHYDALGRINEVGEVDMNHTFFGRTPSELQGDLNASNYPNNLPVHSLTEVTRTYYGDDAGYFTAMAAVPSTHFTINNAYSRGRVVASSLEDVNDANDVTYNHATYYSYDVHGNVKELLQHNPSLNIFTNQEFKLTKYNYDLVSGKVNNVIYQPGMPDQFYHKYEYDADNRITQVYTSSNNVIWNKEAKYFYYLHGPLARIELSDDKVQGLDYAYTLQGWIKGVNSDKLSEDNDIGKDGNLLSTTTNYNNTHKHIARDAFGYSLNYYTNASTIDYTAIDASITSTTRFASDATAIQINALTPVMYNGNIGSMVTSYLNQDPLAVNVNTGASIAINQPFPQANAFYYDQLNRIVRAKSSKVYSPSTNVFTSAGDNKYRESFTYDANGNILTVERFGNSTTMDNMAYYYYNQSGGVYTPNAAGVASPANATNKLAYVTDAISSGTYADDIDNQGTNNYAYDEIGNLISDAAENITNIEWTVYGKIKSIDKSSGADLEFAYDASGNRIMKIVKPTPVSSRWRYTYYIRDAQGNVMATYERGPDALDMPEFKLSEQHMYGSSRLGVALNSINLTNFTGAVNTTTVSRTLGLKSYELSNHLGNVIAVVTDKRNRVLNGGGTLIDHYLPDITSTTDYYSFGAPMPGRKFTGSNSYRYGFNGKENDNETVGTGEGTQDYGMRIYNPALGRFLSVDPLSSEYPFNSTYAFAENSPIAGTDLDGAEFFYAANGAFIGQIGKSTEVRVIDESKVKLKTAVALVKLANAFGVSSEGAAEHVDKFSNSLGVNHDVFLAFGSLVNNETSAGGGKDEAFAIANVTMNYLKDGGGTDLKTLEDVSMYDNSFAQGAKQSEYTKFKNMTPEERNAKKAIAAVINAIGYSKGLEGFTDNTNGADGWDGIDLISSKWDNPHRNYTWSEGSKKLNTEYQKKFNGGVDVSKWSYKKTGVEIESKKIIGKTLFTDVKTNRTEHKQGSKAKFE